MERTYCGAEGATLRYTLHLPPAESQPLYVCLYSGERPEERSAQQAGYVLIRTEKGCLTDACALKAVAALLHEICRDPRVDDMRLYLLGVNRGADGVWALLSLYPRLFTAAVPVGGWGDPYAVRTVCTTPVWSFYRPEDTPQTPAGGARGLADGRLMTLSLRGQGHQQALCSAWTDENPLERADVQRWLRAQSRRTQLEIHCIRPGLWHMEDYFRASCYLVEGKEKALLIDTGMGEVDLPAVVSHLTRLPVELAITHAHGDHYANAGGFAPVYLHERDVKTLPRQIERFRLRHPDAVQADPVKADALRPVKEGDVIDLGGGVRFEVLELPGHTVGSVAYACESLGLIFTGDAMGSGEIVLLYGQRDELHDVIAGYQKHLRHFIARLEGMAEMTFFGGHRMQDASCELLEQERIVSGGIAYYNPLCLQVARDMEGLCGEILAGRCLPAEDGTALTFKYRRGGIVYRLEPRVV